MRGQFVIRSAVNNRTEPRRGANARDVTYREVRLSLGGPAPGSCARTDDDRSGPIS